MKIGRIYQRSTIWHPDRPPRRRWFAAACPAELWAELTCNNYGLQIALASRYRESVYSTILQASMVLLGIRFTVYLGECRAHDPQVGFTP